MDTATGALALEFQLGTLQGAVGLVAVVAAVVGAVAHGDGRHAVLVGALEHASTADARRRAVGQLVRAVSAVFLAVASGEKWQELMVSISNV